MAYSWVVLVLSALIAIHNEIGMVYPSIDIGVCYGLNGDNLPSAPEVIGLYQSNKIGKLRLYDPNPDALNALRGSQIEVTVGIRNEDLPNLAASQDAVNTWFATNVEPYLNDIVLSYITVGNEVIPGTYAENVVPVMHFLQNILNDRKLAGIRVSTVVATSTLAVSYPPSAGEFTSEASSVMAGILEFLSAQSSPLLINAYTYFAYAGDPVNVRLDYALLNGSTAGAPVVQDGSLGYYYLIDAIVDAVFSAMEKLGQPNVQVVISESGWPSAGNGDITTPELASIYNKNFINHIISNSGTPKRPNAYIEGFVFAMFNEDLKTAGVEQNWGLFYPNKQPVYPVFS